MNILEQLAQSSRKRVEKSKENISTAIIKERALQKANVRPKFKEHLQDKDHLSLICELKKASPSKGIICDNFDYLNFAKLYNDHGASAISCLTEPEYFQGSLEILDDVVKLSKLPVLRKDFIVDCYQIYEAKAHGADAILLIVALLSDKTLKSYLDISKEIGLDCLVEVHNEEELMSALKSGAEIVGVNNRNLKDFSVSIDTSAKLAPFIPEEVVFVSESGIHSLEDVKYLKELGADAILIGEQLMASDDISKELQELLHAC